jgi:NAD+ synthase (glutamine-hydrolysing)
VAARVALAQVNATVGDLDGNADLVLEWTRRAVAAGAHLVAFPEMFLTGYPVEDLALRESFINASQSALGRLPERLLAAGLGDITVVVGYLDQADDRSARLGRPPHSPQNSAAVIRQGRVTHRYAKHYLPNYGVFDEFRYFVPGDEPCVFEVHGTKVALAICEDIWQHSGPITWGRAAGVDLLLVINGSPYERDKDDVRWELCSSRAKEAEADLAYVNLVGGQDELVFDGDSLVVDSKGRQLNRAAQFEEALLVTDLGTDRPAPNDGADRLSDDAEAYQALVVGLRDYVDKNGLPSVIIGLSGGIDSALTATIAVDAVGPDRVFGVSMPSGYSSDHSVADAADLAKRTGLHYRTIPIQKMVDAFLSELSLTGLAEENLQARVRGTTLMGLSNQEGHLVLATGNKSELAVGYSTLYGDAVGGFAPLKDLPKTDVWRLATWRNSEAEQRGERAPIPPHSIDKPPSAELRPDQLDTDTLPPYPILDDLLDDYVEGDAGSGVLAAQGFDPELVDRILAMIDHAEFKRRQYPPGPKISLKAFGRDRRLPITNQWRETNDDRSS